MQSYMPQHLLLLWGGRRCSACEKLERKDMLLSVFRVQIGRRSASPDRRLEIRFFIKNPVDFKLVFKTRKTRQTAPKALPKRQKSTLEFIKKRFQGKTMFGNTFITKTSMFEVPSVEISAQKSINKMTWKQARTK